jgi:N-acetylglucosaminyldiphosphoundecaprenol N-acetyl-beta-D-mannosaminyltransferase
MSVPTGHVLGTPLVACTYASLTAELQLRARDDHPFAVDFTNTHIVTLRRTDPEFRRLTSRFDWFVPDGMPLIWCLNLQGLKLRDRVYGPTFMRECIRATPAPFTHYFLGGNDECVRRLSAVFLERHPDIQIVGARNGYFGPDDEETIVEEINRLSPDFIWVGLGTPKQQRWIHEHKSRIRRGIVLAVGFAFDVNAGMKPDAPAWMQRWGLTWVYRLASEPRRLGARYIRYNFLFVVCMLWDGLRGRAFQAVAPSTQMR